MWHREGEILWPPASTQTPPFPHPRGFRQLEGERLWWAQSGGVLASPHPLLECSLVHSPLPLPSPASLPGSRLRDLII